jgi:hypothetical protein
MLTSALLMVSMSRNLVGLQVVVPHELQAMSVVLCTRVSVVVIAMVLLLPCEEAAGVEFDGFTPVGAQRAAQLVDQVCDIGEMKVPRLKAGIRDAVINGVERAIEITIILESDDARQPWDRNFIAGLIQLPKDQRAHRLSALTPHLGEGGGLFIGD